jgi:hypothetical protein
MCDKLAPHVPYFDNIFFFPHSPLIYERSIATANAYNSSRRKYRLVWCVVGGERYLRERRNFGCGRRSERTRPCFDPTAFFSFYTRSTLVSLTYMSRKKMRRKRKKEKGTENEKIPECLGFAYNCRQYISYSRRSSFV